MKTEIKLPVFDSMAQCRAFTGIPIATLRRAKKDGCKGFAHSRVDLAEILKWIFARGAEKVPDAQDELARAKTRLADHKLKVESGNYIPKTEVVEFITKTFNPVREVFVSLPAELATKLNGSDPGEHFAILQNFADEALKKCREHTPK